MSLYNGPPRPGARGGRDQVSILNSVCILPGHMPPMSNTHMKLILNHMCIL